jgi:hypothetical protein
MSKVIFDSKKILEYYHNNQNLIPHYQSDSSYFFSLHWSDSGGLKFKDKSTIDFIQKKLDSIFDVQMWIMNDSNVKAVRLYDLYLEMMNCFKNQVVPQDLLKTVSVSFLSPNGPFKKIQLISTLNPETFDYFIYKELINKNIPSRKFRLHSHSLMLIGTSQQNFVVNVKQITMDGLLVVCNKKYTQLFQDHDTHIYMTIEKWNKFLKTKSGQDPFFSFAHGEGLSFDGKSVIQCKNYNNYLSQDDYLFIPFKSFIKQDLCKNIQEFLLEEENNIIRAA